MDEEIIHFVQNPSHKSSLKIDVYMHVKNGFVGQEKAYTQVHEKAKL